MKIFGDEWKGTPAGEDGEWVEAPVGAECVDCLKPVVEGQSGVILALLDVTREPGKEYTMEPKEQPYHRECFLESVFGPNFRGFITKGPE